MIAWHPEETKSKLNIFLIIPLSLIHIWELGLEEEYVRKRVEKYTAIEKIKSNVDKAVGDVIRDYQLDGVKVDEDYKSCLLYTSRCV